jgi:NAD-reducing hydrogenase small subunit
MSGLQKEPSKKLRLATIWLDGCSGCHMSLLDMDERLVDVADRLDIVYSPIVDTRIYPEAVDVCLVEGAVSTQEDIEKLLTIRSNTRLVVSLGDCAVTANVSGMRNRFKLQDVLSHAYLENATHHPQIPGKDIPALLDTVRPVHAYIDVDLFIPGCPPPADAIFSAMVALIEDRIPDLTGMVRFG